MVGERARKNVRIVVLVYNRYGYLPIEIGRNMKNIFTEHPNSVGESYWQHLMFAGIFGFKMIIGGLFCLIHAIFPFLFQNTGSNFLLNMTHDFVTRMPNVDERVMRIHQAIESKKNKASS
jgi:hypothetical protein